MKLSLSIGIIALGTLACSATETQTATQTLCTPELLDIAMEWGRWLGCVGQAVNGSSSCATVAEDMLTTTWSAYANPNCAARLRELVSEHVGKVDVTELGQMLNENMNCTLGEDGVSHCSTNATQTIQLLSKDFIGQLLHGVSDNWIELARQTVVAIDQLAACAQSSETLKPANGLAEGELENAKTKLAMAKTEIMRPIKAAKSQLNSSQLAAAKMFFKTLFPHLSTTGLSKATFVDLSHCQSAWNTTEHYLSALLQLDESQTAVSALFGQLHFLKPLEGLVGAFFETQSQFRAEVSEGLSCQFSWTNISQLESCVDALHQVMDNWAGSFERVIPKQPIDSQQPLMTTSPSLTHSSETTDARPIATGVLAPPLYPAESFNEAQAGSGTTSSWPTLVLSASFFSMLVVLVLGGLAAFRRRKGLRLFAGQRTNDRAMDEPLLSLEEQALMETLTDSEDDEMPLAL